MNLKSIITTALLLTIMLSFGQEEYSDIKEIGELKVSKIIIYPGCEKYSSRKNLLVCFSKKLMEELYEELNSDSFDIYNAGVIRVNFIINKKGELIITDIEDPYQIDEDLIDLTKTAFKRINSKYKRKKKKGKVGIIPAKDENGDPIDVSFFVPLTFYNK